MPLIIPSALVYALSEMGLSNTVHSIYGRTMDLYNDIMFSAMFLTLFLSLLLSIRILLVFLAVAGP